MNILFTDLNEILHQQLQNVSEYMQVQYSYMTHFGGSKEGNGSTENEERHLGNYIYLQEILSLGCKMASRYAQECFFQHTLINISFTDLNEIIHPQAENIPEYIQHYASAVSV